MFIINISKVNLKWKLEDVIENVLIMMGVVTLIFSGTTLSTPSFYLNTLPAFALMYLECNDNFERLIKAMFAILIGASYLFLPEGDITASLYFLGKQPFFTLVANYMNEHGAFCSVCQGDGQRRKDLRRGFHRRLFRARAEGRGLRRPAADRRHIRC